MPLSAPLSVSAAHREFIIAMSNLIQRLAVDHIHIVGDIFDRGPGPHIIMDKLMAYHSVDIQWGNHDVVWMGAAAGHQSLHCQCDPCGLPGMEIWICWRTDTASI